MKSKKSEGKPTEEAVFTSRNYRHLMTGMSPAFLTIRSAGVLVF